MLLVSLSTSVAAGGLVTISSMNHHSDNGGEVVYALGDGAYVFLYDTTDQFAKNMQATMLATWIAEKMILSYQVGASPDSNCSLWSSQLTSVMVP
jgi:hypothetical protein